MSETFSIELADFPANHPAGCRACAQRVVERVRALRGVTRADIVERAQRIVGAYEPELVTVAAIDDAAKLAIAENQSHWQFASLAIEGMDCADCARSIERGLNRVPGIALVDVSFGAARMDVEYDARRTNAADIDRVIQGLGYRVSQPAVDGESERAAVVSLLRRRGNVLTLSSGLFLLAGIVATIADAPHGVATALFAMSVAVAGVPLALRGVRTAWVTRAPDINLLMMIAVTGAIILGEWFEAATVVFLFSLGEALEGYAMDRVRRSVRSLLSLAPPMATIVRDGTEHDLPVGEVTTGEVIVVRPGARVPLDAVVLSGASSVDQAVLTGESIPVLKEQGDPIFAGTMNADGPLIARVTRPSSDSSVARIIHLVEQAQSSRAPTQRLVDRFAVYYTPAVIALAVMIAVVPVAMGGDWQEWVGRALVLLVIACPCALVISTPVSIVSALSAAAKRGILVKGGAALERAGTIDTVALDKTGTLTTGRPSVTAVMARDGHTEAEVLSIAAALERHSEHPLGKAVVTEAVQRGLSVDEVSDMRVAAGQGVLGTLDGREWRVGSRRMFAGVPAGRDVEELTRSIEATGGTAAYVGTQDEIVGVLGFADALRPDAPAAVRDLHRAGIEKVVMLTGDAQSAATTIATAAGIDTVQAGLLPDGKLAEVQALRESGRTVAMVGDGINDAPSLAAADLGIAMGVAGTDAAIETADVALMGDSLSGVANTIRLGRRTRRTIWLNVTFSIGVKLLTLALAVAGLASLWMAIAADVGASLLVIGNGLLLLRWRD
jgi:Cd2+/Zn2+-exporting ATPase